MSSDTAGDVQIVVGAKDDALAAELVRVLTAFNMAATGVTEEGAISVKVTDAGGALVAGLSGWTWGQRAGINLVWVREGSRGQGLGARLLAAAEAVATERGCDRVFVSSLTFQAPGFYAKNGYVETARVEDILADGVADVWFVKRLSTVLSSG